jgi:hypothetical protein
METVVPNESGSTHLVETVVKNIFANDSHPHNPLNLIENFIIYKMARKVARRVTAKKVLDLGLTIAGANARQRNSSLSTRLRRFKTCFGSDPLVYARIWEDLAQIDVERKLVSTSK